MLGTLEHLSQRRAPVIARTRAPRRYYHRDVLELHDLPADPHSPHEGEALTRLAGRRVSTRFDSVDDARTHAQQTLDRTADTSTWADVVDGAEVVGWVWLGAEGDELLVNDIVLDSPSRAGELLPALAERARGLGARMVGIGVVGEDPAREGLGSQPGFTVRATNMALSLDGVIAEPAPVSLHPMSETEFDVWVEGEVEGYAEELAATGMSAERALERSRTQLAGLIPAGVESPGMEFFMARVDDEVVGDLWLDTSAVMAFVYNIEVAQAHRRRGYGGAIMNAAALHSRDAGHPYLGLNVFGHNPNARALYDKLGYRVTLDYRALDVPDGG
jgi:ribosomal protein S18 acetylase RimI-like enzyme